MMAELGDQAMDSPCCGEMLLPRPSSSDIPVIDCVLEGSNSGFVAMEETWNKTPLMEALDDLYTPVSSTSLQGDYDYEGNYEAPVSQWRVQGSQLIKLSTQNNQSKHQLAVTSHNDLMSHPHDIITFVTDSNIPVDKVEPWHETSKLSKGVKSFADDCQQITMTPDSTNNQSVETMYSGHPHADHQHSDSLSDGRISPSPASPKKKFPCSICGMCFENLKALTSHVVSHALCKCCGLVFRDAESLEIHKKVQHGGNDKAVPSIKITPTTKIAITTIASKTPNLHAKPSTDNTGSLKLMAKSKKVTMKGKVMGSNGDGTVKQVHANAKTVKVACSVCKKSFRNPTRLLAHARSVHNKCGICDKQCDNADLLCAHERDMHYKCAVCGWIASNGLAALEKHESLHIQCLQCKARFKNHQALAAHHSISRCTSEVHLTPPVFKLELQEDQVTSSARPSDDDMVDQCSTLHGPVKQNGVNHEFDEPDQLVCPTCSLVIDGNDHQCSAVTCGFCERTFSNPEGLKQHQLREHFECTECEVIFKNFDSLSLHEELQHFCCAVCKKRCSNHEVLSQHKRQRHVKCKLCKCWFEDWGALEKHETLGPFPCGECYSDFCTLHSLRLHEKETHLLCSICQVVCASREELQIHTHHPCRLCGLEFNCTSALQDHNNRDHPQCVTCGGVYRDNQALERHRSVQHPLFKCSLCLQTYENQEKLGQHMDESHPQSEEDDNLVDNSDTATKQASPGNSEAEPMTTDDEENYPTDLSLRIPNYLVKQDERNEPRHLSPKCLPLNSKAASKRHLPFYLKNLHKHSKKSSSRSGSIRRSSEGDIVKQEGFLNHVTSRLALSESEAVNGTNCKSSKSRLWPCEACEKVFNLKRNLRAHMRRVHIDRVSRSKAPLTQYTCSLCCTVFTSKQQFSLHKPDCYKMRENKNGRVVCNICGKTFSTSGNLAQHKRIHTSEKPYKCDTCGKTFAQNGTLYRHKTVHTKETPFACQVCGKQFGLKGNLVMHLRNIHKIIHKSDGTPL